MDAVASASGGNTDSSREYELKLVGKPRDFGTLKTRIDRHVGSARGWSGRMLRTIYYDTPDRDLAAAGVALRVRKVGRRHIQCVKVSNGAIGILDRREWETPVRGPVPDLALLPVQAAAYLSAVADKPLEAVFETRFERRARTITHLSAAGLPAEVEIAIDTGAVEAGEISEPIKEVEFELKRGDPGDLFDLALALTEGTSLHPFPLSKAERGHRLSLGARGLDPVFAPKPVLVPGATVSDTLASVFRIAIDTLTANEPVALDGADPEGVHQMRVAIRRMRTALSVFRAFIDPERTAWFAAELRWLMAALGPARDWDVFIAEIAGTVEGPGVDPASRAILLEGARAERDAAYAAIRDALASTRYARAVMRLTAFSETRGWQPRPPDPASPLATPVRDVAPKILNKAHTKVLKKGRKLAKLTMEERHELRIRIKKLRYAVEFLQGLYGDAGRKAYRKRLTDLQDRFGHLNDVAVAERLVGEILGHEAGRGPDERAQRLRVAAGAVLGWHARGLNDGEDKLLDDWESFAKSKPFWPKP